MLTNYLKTALRSLASNRTFSVINIAGLAIGIASSILILTVVLHEFSYDHFHDNGSRIFRAEKQFSRDGRHSLYANPQFGASLMEVDPRVVNYVRTFSGAGRIVRSDDSHAFFEDKFVFADTSFFSVFSFPLRTGNYHSLQRSGTAIISESIAQKYFGSIDVVGRVLTFDNQYQLEITGVALDAPVNSTIQFGIVASFATLMIMPERDIVNSDASGFPTYVLLNDAAALESVSASITKTGYTNDAITYSLAPLFDNHFNFNFGSTATTRYAYSFASVALLILLMALINYMNLTTARATSRAKEVGVRKVIGAQWRALSLQFYIESAVTTIISFLLALVLVEVCRPLLTDLLGLQIDETFLHSRYLYGAIVILVLACIFIAGSYPAAVLPRFKPTEVLNGRFSSSGRGAWLRKFLTVFQFSVSVCIAICAVIMNNQVAYMSAFNVGIDREQVLVLPVKTLSPAARRSLRQQLTQRAGIENAAIASIPFYKNQTSGVSLVTSPVTNEKVGAKWIIADRSFFSTLGVPFKNDIASTPGVFHILNSSAATAFGMSDLSGEYNLTMGGDHVPSMSGKIGGVVTDFNYESPRNQVQPLIISVVSDSASYIGESPTIYVRLPKGKEPSTAIASIRSEYDKLSDGSPFTYYFLDDAFNEQQLSEARLNRLFLIFTGVALVIACLGLSGLITFSSEQRKKELSIRKLLGASIPKLLTMISSNLVLLLLLSAMIATPVALYISEEWLSGFFYQAGISITDILLPIIVVITISLVIICTQGLRTALGSPVKNLKSE